MGDRDKRGLPADLHRMLATKEGPDLDKAVQLALGDVKVLRELLDGIVSKKETYRYNCYKVLLRISESQPQALYPEWDHFVELFGSDNSYHRCASINIIANLVSIVEERRFEQVFDQYFALLDDEKMIPAVYVAQSAGKIARAKSHLQAGITERLLRIDETHHAEGRKDLIKGAAIESFGEYCEGSPDRERMLAFAERQLECSSPKTRKIAKKFLDRHGK